MPHYKNARRIGFASVFAGLIFLFFFLFLQPKGLSGLAITMLPFSISAESSVLDALSLSAFWLSLAMLLFGSLSVLLSALWKSRSYKTKRRDAAAQYSCTDEGEENWIFI